MNKNSEKTIKNSFLAFFKLYCPPPGDNGYNARHGPKVDYNQYQLSDEYLD